LFMEDETPKKKPILNPFAKKRDPALGEKRKPLAPIATQVKVMKSEISGQIIPKLFDKSTWGAAPKDDRPHIVTTVPKSASVPLPNAIRSLINRKAQF
jgi:hypothetical protein